MKILLFVLLIGMVKADDYLDWVEKQSQLAESIEKTEYQNMIQQYQDILEQLNRDYPTLYNSFHRLPEVNQVELLKTLSPQSEVEELREKIIFYQKNLIIQ